MRRILLVGLVGCGRIGFASGPDGSVAGDSPDGASPAAALVYANTPNALYRIDAATLGAPHIGPFSGACASDSMTDIALDSSGALFGISLYEPNP
jgi:hypothetical protein